MDVEVTQRLEQLHQLCLDCHYAFEDAVKRIENPFIRNKLVEYNREHSRALDHLEALLLTLNGTSPERTQSRAGIYFEVSSLLRSSVNDQQALLALRQLERVFHHAILDSLKALHGEGEVVKILNHFLAIEGDHSAYLREALAHPESFEHGPSEF